MEIPIEIYETADALRSLGYEVSPGDNPSVIITDNELRSRTEWEGLLNSVYGDIYEIPVSDIASKGLPYFIGREITMAQEISKDKEQQYLKKIATYEKIITGVVFVGGIVFIYYMGKKVLKDIVRDWTGSKNKKKKRKNR